MKNMRILLVGFVLLVILAKCQKWDLSEIIPDVPDIKVKINLPGSKSETPQPSEQNKTTDTVEPKKVTPSAARVQNPPLVEQQVVFYSELKTISVSQATSLAISPQQPHVNLPVQSILGGETVQLIASDQNGAWLLILHENTIGWIPSIYLGFGSGSIEVTALYQAEEEPCDGYLGSIVELSEIWDSNYDGDISFQGYAYLPENYPINDRWVTLLNSQQIIEPQVTTTKLEDGGTVSIFSGYIANVSVGDAISFSNESAESTKIPFQASYFTADCSQAIAEIPQGNYRDSGAVNTPAPTIRVITLEVITTSEHSSPNDDGSMNISATPYKACNSDYLSRLHVGDRAYVSYTPPERNIVRIMPYKHEKEVGRIDPGEKVKIIKGPSCSNGYVWWKVTSERDGLTGWTSEGDAENYWLIPIP